MRKLLFVPISLILVCLFFGACNDDKTPQELMKEETKAIDRFLNRNGIKVLKSYPTDRPFEDNEYFKTKEGLYIQVVDSGNGKRARIGKETVLVRFDHYFYVKAYVGGDDTVYEFNSSQPYSFEYGLGQYSGLACAGWAIPLEYMGENAIVNLIIPSSQGSKNDRSSYLPIFYKNLSYRFY